MSTRNFSFAALISIIAAGAALPPSIALAADMPTTKVAFQDLDLTHSSGIAALYGRLRAASVEVCRPLESKRVEDRFRHSHCVKSALEQAIAQVGKPALAAHYQAKATGSMRAETVARR